MNNTENKNKVVLKKMIKKQFFITVITSFFLLFIVIGSSYSVFSSKTETGLTDVVVQSGNLLASISSTSETIVMNYETLGVSDEVGLSYEPYTFTVKNNGENLIKYYELRIVDKEYGNSTLPHKAINYSLSKNGEDYTEPQNLGDNRSYIYVGGSLEPGESDTFDLKMWVNEEFGKYANNKEINASIEITLYSDIPTRNYINYDTQGGSYIPKTITTSKRVTNQIPLKRGYSFVGWSTTPNGDVEYESNALYDGDNGITLYAVWDVLPRYLYNELESTLTSNLKEPDSDGTRFVYGSSVDNNYVWYSGKLWRVVSLNSDGTIKLVTQNNITSIAWDINGNNNYSTSQVRQWLNSEFLPTLQEDLIANSNWDYTQYISFPSEKLQMTSFVNDKVGLLNIYEYMMTGGTNDYSTSKTYLNNDYFWWLISSAEEEFEPIGTIYNIWGVHIYSISSARFGNEAYNYNNVRFVYGGVRPSINIIENVNILEGTGTKNDPYKLKKDKKIAISEEYLNERISGEYIKFNNTLYRIVGMETINNQKLTKITMADYSKKSNTIHLSQQFGNSGVFSKATGIGLYLDNWYGDSLYLSNTYKEMIATDSEGVLWYQGPTDGTGLDYTKSKQGTGISATIGLPYYGEMFSTQFGPGDEDSVGTWLMTKGNSTGLNVWHVDNDGCMVEYDTGTSSGVRPSMYLKSNVKIKDTNDDGKIGTGLPNDPYEIVCTECS